MKRRSDERGFILISLYMVLGILVILGSAMLTYAMAEVRAAHRSQASMQALYLAEAGLDQAIVQLRADSTWTAGFAAVPIGVTGDYTVTVDNTLPDDRIRLFSTGTTSVSQINNTRMVDAIVSIVPQSLFRFAAFGDEQVTISGSGAIDSYNSTDGPYDPATAGSSGDVGTNSTFAGGVTLSGDAIVNGDAWVGRGGDPTTVIEISGNNADITGTRDDLPQSEPMIPNSDPTGVLNQGDLNISGNNVVTLPGDTYWYDNISISGEGRLNFQGQTTIYVSGQLSVSGQGIGTASDLPPNLIIRLIGDGNVNFSGQADFYGAISAPQSQISISGEGGLYGAVIGREFVDSGNGGVHFDEALLNIPGDGPAVVNVVAWRES